MGLSSKDVFEPSVVAATPAFTFAHEKTSL